MAVDSCELVAFCFASTRQVIVPTLYCPYRKPPASSVANEHDKSDRFHLGFRAKPHGQETVPRLHLTHVDVRVPRTPERQNWGLILQAPHFLFKECLDPELLILDTIYLATKLSGASQQFVRDLVSSL